MDVITSAQYKKIYDIMLADVISDIYFLSPRQVHITPSSLECYYQRS